MNQDPQTFRFKYSDDKRGNESYTSGFATIKTPEFFIRERHVTLVCSYCNRGVMATFTILDFVQPNDIIKDGAIEFSHPYFKELVSRTFHDKDVPLSYRPIMDALASQDLRGRTAQTAARELWWDLFLFGNEMREFLPDVVRFYEESNLDFDRAQIMELEAKITFLKKRKETK